MKIDQIQTVIAESKSKGLGPLRELLWAQLGEVTTETVMETENRLVSLVESMPDRIQTAHNYATENDLTDQVQPLLDEVVRYFLEPMDLIPEMALGMIGLLDDAYVTLKIMNVLPEGCRPADSKSDLDLLRTMLGDNFSNQLDGIIEDIIEQKRK